MADSCFNDPPMTLIRKQQLNARRNREINFGKTEEK